MHQRTGNRRKPVTYSLWRSCTSNKWQNNSDCSQCNSGCVSDFPRYNALFGRRIHFTLELQLIFSFEQSSFSYKEKQSLTFLIDTDAGKSWSCITWTGSTFILLFIFIGFIHWMFCWHWKHTRKENQQIPQKHNTGELILMLLLLLTVLSTSRSR